MAYRFTDTVKWNDTWFCELKPLSKLLFLYLCDQCDIAGFLELNVKKISFDLGTGKQEVERGMKEVSNKLIYSKDKRFIFIKKFLQHQRNLPLKETNRAHIAILNLLNKNLQLFDITSIDKYFEGGSMGDASPLGIGNSIGDSKGNGIEKENVELIYNSYPTRCVVGGRSTGKSEKCKEKIKTSLKTIQCDKLVDTIKWYVEDCKKTNTYMKNFPTFLNNIPDMPEEYKPLITNVKPNPNESRQ